MNEFLAGGLTFLLVFVTVGLLCLFVFGDRQ
jgi:hypothetical protein